MDVTVMSATEDPIDNISLAAGNCYDKHNVSEKRIRSCVKSGHTSIIEHAYITFKIAGVSRSMLAQITRHRLMSFCVQSQRYCRYNLVGNDWYVMPDKIADASADVQASFRASMAESASTYMALLEGGMKPEDARYVLPEATKTDIVCSMNARELYNFLSLRLSPRASAEIHKCAEAMMDAASNVNEQWASLISIFEDNMKLVM